MLTVPLLLIALTAQASPRVVHGVVRDATGLPLVGVTIALKGTPRFVVSDERGEFVLTIAPATDVALVASLPGFEPKVIRLAANSPATNLTVGLDIAKFNDQVSVRGAVPKVPAREDYALSPIDVVRTPGTQADLMRALQTLAGVNQIDEGAGLFVRGGDASEVLVLLDGGTMAHPYRYETPTGGFRGAIDPFLTAGLSFTTGGFSARYGNVLSAVLDLRGLARPETDQVNATAGLAGLSGSLAAPIGDAAGVRIGANRAAPSVLFAVNGSPRDFDRYPGGWDLSGSFAWSSPAAGEVRVFGLTQRDHVGVRVEHDAFADFLHSGTSHEFVVGRWARPLGVRWHITGSLANDSYARLTDVGVLNVSVTDRVRSTRVDVTGPIGGWDLRVGADATAARTVVVGSVPQRGGDLGGVSGASDFLVSTDDWHAGAYTEIAHRFAWITPTLGVRSDYFSRAQAATVDPRIDIRFDVSRSSHLRIASGLYHQAPSASYYDQIRGADRLPPMAASHYVLGYERGVADGPAFLRIEAYHKRYRHLPLEDASAGFTADGYGTADGVDVFARRLWPRLELRGNASWLRARRRWTSDEQRDRYPLPLGTWRPDFDIPYSWQAVASFTVTRPLSIAAAWKTAAGRPYTPVEGALPTAAGYVPTYGAINSGRLPRYERADVSASLMKPFGVRSVAIFFASVDNIAGRRNFFEYAYSADYTLRRPVVSTAPRTFYVGVSVTR